MKLAKKEKKVREYLHVKAMGDMRFHNGAMTSLLYEFRYNHCRESHVLLRVLSELLKKDKIDEVSIADHQTGYVFSLFWVPNEKTPSLKELMHILLRIENAGVINLEKLMSELNCAEMDLEIGLSVLEEQGFIVMEDLDENNTIITLTERGKIYEG